MEVKTEPIYYIIDFDSTFTRVEALDILCEISLRDSEDKDEVLTEIRRLTDLGMEGKMPLAESLETRIKLLRAHQSHLNELIDILKTKVSDSFQRNKDFLQKYADQIIIISNGFKDFIEPIVTQFGIKPENIYANEFKFDKNGNITGLDKDNILAENKGKARQIKELNLKGEIHVLGDGYTDYEIKEEGVADKFFAFTENISRENVLSKADYVTPSLDEYLYVNKLPMAISYPKNRIKVLLLENIHPEAAEMFKKEGYNVDIYNAGMDEAELMERIKDVSILGIRSKTQITEKVIKNANRLITIGAFCIGTNQINLDACLNKGIAVFNAPYSNTRSVVELVIGEIIMLERGIFPKSQKMHKGVWDKSAKNSYEIRGKKLGIVGYGNIGAQLSVLAESLGMEVYYYDIVERLSLGNAKKCRTLHELLNTADIITLHVDGRSENKNHFGKDEFEAMKDGSVLINLSRGFVVDIEALAESLKNGKLRGASVDVFPKEPKSNDEEFVSELRGIDNCILTPHIGGSTEEAQLNIAEFVPERIIDYINTGNSFNSVNFPNLQLPELKNGHRLIHIHQNAPGILAKINNILADNDINILGQYLKTNENVGYVITDVHTEYNKKVIEELKSIEHTIRFRVLY